MGMLGHEPQVVQFFVGVASGLFVIASVLLMALIMDKFV